MQQRWKETGLVPQQNVKDLWETYNLHVENFYNFIKINKELRDLDLKKNYEQKLALCEAAEALVLEPSIVEAFHKLQKLHDEWRETGPVANEFKETLWERFKEASSRINKQHQAFFENIKAEQTKNLELKAGLCEQTEELAQQLYTTRKEWNRASDRLLEIQKVWKTIGFAPKKDNTRIYERFRTACDRFFEAKRRFYADVKTEMEHNLQLKNELCEAAEALQMSEEWKKTTDELIALQARWKEIGAVSRRYSDQVWKRFRAACDKFFERKAAHFSDVDGQYEQNLVRKQALLDEMAAADVKEGGFEMIKEFQRRWSEIGFVPIKRKDEIQKRYKECVDTLFSVLRGAVSYFTLCARLFRPLWAFWAEVLFSFARLAAAPLRWLQKVYGKLAKLCKRYFLFSRNRLIIKSYERSARYSLRRARKKEAHRHGRAGQKRQKAHQLSHDARHRNSDCTGRGAAHSSAEPDRRRAQPTHRAAERS